MGIQKLSLIDCFFSIFQKGLEEKKMRPSDEPNDSAYFDKIPRKHFESETECTFSNNLFYNLLQQASYSRFKTIEFAYSIQLFRLLKTDDKW